ncbi:HEAT repeat domain-containing protein [Streptomyces sp. Ru73]|uniref:HEAT repeat domain-containing protein n=1 Tax=Streptomyces sp. Ru73 TaxID=2080748 RepID=UPI0011B0C793|nr:HEAT repeat domain-containing protein [Streptomyces sp. Ru73]
MTDIFSSRTYLLSPRSNEEEVATVAEKLGWPLIGRLPEDVSALAPRETFWGKSQDLVLHYQEDVISKSPCAFLTGANKKQVETAARLLEAQLKPATLEELLKAAEATKNLPDDYALAVLRLGLGAPEHFDERFSASIARAVAHEDEEVRKSAAWATSYTAWPQFVPLLTEMAEQDPSENVRRVAQKILNAYTGEGTPEE